MAMAIGLQESISNQFEELESPAEWAEAEEQRRVWWGIVILDRYYQTITQQAVMLFRGTLNETGKQTCQQNPQSSSRKIRR